MEDLKFMVLIVFLSIIVIVIALIAVVALLISKKNKKSNTTVNGSGYSVQDRMVAHDYKINSWGNLIKIIVISGISGLIGYYLSTIAEADPVLYTFLGAGFPWGWSVINKIIDDWIEFWTFLASGWAWLILFLLKIGLSLLLGAFIMPIKLIISIYNICKAHSLSKEVNTPVEVVSDNATVEESNE